MAVQETPYRRQVATRAGPAGATVNPESFGAGLGRQMVATGQMMHREALEDYALERRETARAETAQAHRAYALHRQNMSDIAREARRLDGSPGHAARMAEAWEAGRESILNGITDDDVHAQMTASFDEAQVRFRENEADFELVQGVKRTLAAEADTQDLQANQVMRGDPKDFPEELRIGRERILGYNLPEEQERRALAELDDSLGTASIRRLIELDPEVALKAMNEGLYDYVDPNRIAVLRNHADVEVRSRANAQRSLQELERRRVGESVSLTIEQVNDGVEHDPEQLAMLRQQAIAAELPDAQLYDIDKAISRNTVNREFRAASASTIAAEISAIDTQLAGQTQDDPALVMRRNDLSDLLTQRREQIDADQLGWAAQNGIAVAPFSLTAGRDDVNSWVVAAEAVAGSTGRAPKYLPVDGEAQLREMAQSGKAGALAVLEFAGRFGTGRAEAVARQIRPDDAAFAYLVNLPAQSRELALSGQAAAAGNKQLLTPDADAKPEFDERVAVQERQFARATIGMDEAQRAGIRETAEHLLAGYVSRGHRLSPAMRWTALNQALGASGTPGATMRGGIHLWGAHEAPVVVPKTMTMGEFSQQVQRAWRVNGPVNPDGSAARLSASVPVRIGPTQYRFESSSGAPFVTAEGMPFVVDVARRYPALPQAAPRRRAGPERRTYTPSTPNAARGGTGEGR